MAVGSRFHQCAERFVHRYNSPGGRNRLPRLELHQFNQPAQASKLVEIRLIHWRKCASACFLGQVSEPSSVFVRQFELKKKLSHFRRHRAALMFQDATKDLGLIGS
jgi:hypothetical protein